MGLATSPYVVNVLTLDVLFSDGVAVTPNTIVVRTMPLAISTAAITFATCHILRADFARQRTNRGGDRCGTLNFGDHNLTNLANGISGMFSHSLEIQTGRG